MSMPKSVIKLDKNGFKFTDNVDATQYTLQELIRVALKDSCKYVVSRARANSPKRTRRGQKQIQYFVRRYSKDGKGIRGEVGIKGKGFYMRYHELGNFHVKKVGMLYNAAHDNIPEIISIQKKYLSGIESPGVESMIDENDYDGGEENK